MIGCTRISSEEKIDELFAWLGQMPAVLSANLVAKMVALERRLQKLSRAIWGGLAGLGGPVLSFNLTWLRLRLKLPLRSAAKLDQLTEPPGRRCHFRHGMVQHVSAVIAVHCETSAQ